MSSSLGIPVPLATVAQQIAPLLTQASPTVPGLVKYDGTSIAPNANGALSLADASAGTVSQTVFASPVPRDISGRLSDVYSIEDAGVVNDPDGVRIAANTAAYLDAWAKVSGRARLRHKAGLSIVVSPLILSAPIYLELDGLLQLAPAVNAGLLMLGGSNNVITGNGVLDANRANQTGMGTGGYGIATPNGGLTGGLIEGVTVQNAYNWPLNVVASKNFTVRKVTLQNSGNSPEFASGCDNCHLIDSDIIGINDEGFAFYGGVTNSSAQFVRVSGCNSGINVFADTAQPNPCSNIEMIGCRAWGNQNAGFAVSTNGVSAIHSGVKLLGNFSYGNNSSLFSTGCEVYLNAVKAWSVEGNHLYGTLGASSIGLNMSATAEYGTIGGNTIYDIGSSGTNGVGVQFGGGAGVVYRGGLIYDDRPTPLMAYGADGTLGANGAILDLAGFGFIGALNNVTASTGAGGNALIRTLGGNLMTVEGYLTVMQAMQANGAITANGGVNVAGAANGIGINGSSAGNSPTIVAFGSDANINLELAGKGTGAVQIVGNLILGNQFVSGTVPTASGYLTIQDNTGTTYYIPVAASA